MPRILLAAVATALTAAGLATAATPEGGATYSGKLVEAGGAKPPTIKLKVNSSSTKLKATIGCSGQSYALKGVPIDADGTFEKKGKIDGIETEVEGRFKSVGKATGTVESPICFLSSGVAFSAKR